MDLDKVLLDFGEGNVWTVRDAVRGTQIFGGIGSGKSSGSGRVIAKQFLQSGFGGLVLCAKPDEVTQWLGYSLSNNRWEDVIVMGEQNKFEIWAEYLEEEERFDELDEFKRKYSWEKGNDRRFNPLQYELTRSGKGAGEVLNLSNLFMAIYKMSNRLSGGGSSGGGANSRFWDGALKRLLNRMIQLLQLAKEEISIAKMRQIISDIPLAEEADRLNSDEMSQDEIDKWGEENFCIGCILNIGDNIDEENKNEVDKYNIIYNYFLREFPNLPDETRPSIIESFLGIAEPFSTGILKEYFASGLNLYPEETHNGKIIILDFAVKEYLDSGVYSQGIYKLLWQQATERRKKKKGSIPVFLWVDEAQLFMSDYDQIFQTTARSSRACTVFISQNISNYYVAIGGSNPQARADSLLGNLGTKIFHSNNDSVTNEWASKTIGSDFQTLGSGGKSVSYTSLSFTTNEGFSTQLIPQVIPKIFTQLKSGGKLEKYIVEGIVTITGYRWNDIKDKDSKKNFRKIGFKQKIK